MFRQGLRRCATQARSTASAALVSQCRASLPVARYRIAPLAASVTGFQRIASFQRSYSSEAAAEAPLSGDATSSESTRFADLSNAVHPVLIDAVTKGMGYETMTPVQAKTILPALKGTDIVAQAKTGTGKTLAFLLPMLQRMIDEDPTLASTRRIRARSDDIRAIVLSPTRELAEQIANEARQVTRNTGLVVQSAVGGTMKREMLQRTQRQGCHILVATPGRLNDLLSDPRSGIRAPNLAALVLDEADRMLDVGFEKELHDIIAQLPSDKPRQTMLVSATIPDNVIRLARAMVRPDDFEFVQTIPENESLTHDRVPQHLVPVSSWNNMFPSLFELIDREAAKAETDPAGKPFKAIVYLNTTSMVQLSGELTFQRRREKLGAHDLRCYAIHSGLSQHARQRTADNFKTTRSGVLFSSDVTARGMDFPNVTHVIQLDVPRERETYIHRLGRTGRQNKEGEGWILVPQASLSTARKTLRGLPIKENTSLSSAEVKHDAEELPQYHEQTLSLFKTLDSGLLRETYRSMFGAAHDKRATAEDVNNWAVVGWGLDAPPAVSQNFIDQQGLSRVEGFNIGHSDYNGGGGSRRNFGDNGGSRSFDGNRSSDDPFSAMKRNIRYDSAKSGGYGNERSGGSNFGRRDNNNRFGGNRGRRDSGRPSWGDRGSRNSGRSSGRGGDSW